MQKKSKRKYRKKGREFEKKYCREDQTETSNSESEGKCGKNNRKALIEPWKLENERKWEREGERILFVQIEAADQAYRALKNQLVTLFGENLTVVNRERF